MSSSNANAKQSVSFSIDADEIVDPSTTITVRLPAAVTAHDAQAAVRLMHGVGEVPCRISLGRNGRSIRVSLKHGAAECSGSYCLELGELRNAKGDCITEQERLPFSVVPAAGKAPAGQRVEHSVRVVFDDLDVVRLKPGETGTRGHVDVIKVVDRKTGATSELAFDEQGKAVDIGKRLAGLNKRRFAKFGKLDRTLAGRLETAKEGQRIPIIVWAHIELPPAPYEKPADRPSNEPPKGEAQAIRSFRTAMGKLNRVLERCEVAVHKDSHRDEDLPFVRAQATVEQIRELSVDELVGAIYVDDRTAINDLGDSVSVARSDQAHALGFDGTGVRVAVFEEGPSVTTNLTFAGRYTNSPPASDHARLTSAVIKNTERRKPHGHAPDCDLYSANSYDNDALLWAVRDQHCTVVSQSFHRSTEPEGAGL